MKNNSAAPLFAALGDETRLKLVNRLCHRSPQSITELAHNTRVTRQAITKHLRTLQGVGIVRNIRSGRQSLFELKPEPLAEMRKYLDTVAEQWDQALNRLKAFVEV